MIKVFLIWHSVLCSLNNIFETLKLYRFSRLFESCVRRLLYIDVVFVSVNLYIVNVLNLIRITFSMAALDN